MKETEEEKEKKETKGRTRYETRADHMREKETGHEGQTERASGKQRHSSPPNL